MMGQSFKKELIEKFYQADKDAVYTFYYNYVDAQMLPRLEKVCSPEYISLYKKITSFMSTLDPTINERGLWITFLDLCE